MSKFGIQIKSAHKRMSRVLGYVLTLNNSESWFEFRQLAKARLTEQERSSLAIAALQSLSPELMEAVIEACAGGAGYPLPAMLGQMDDARFWASHANRRELKAYALAAYDALPVHEQNAFYQHIREVTV